MKYSQQQMDTIVRSMTSGIHGSFAARIGDALMIAETGNREILEKAFKGLFDRVARFLDIVPIFDEAKHEAFIERRMDMFDKQLMQGKISQKEYEVMVGILNRVTA